MKRTTIVSVIVLLTLTLTEAFAQKSIYTPKDLRQMNLLADTSMWSYTRMECTENFAIMWQKGFGYDLSCPPKLEGQPMRVDLDNLKENSKVTMPSFATRCSLCAQGQRRRGCV